MSSTQMFKVYNTHNNFIIKVNDAVKITSLPQYESFWVEINTINYQTKEITGTVQNRLQRDHSFNHKDIVSFKKNNVKDHRLEKDRFDITRLDQAFVQKIVNSNRNMSIEELEQTINIQYLKIEE
jgi:hypothetical protein